MESSLIIAFSAVFISAVAQIILKKTAVKNVEVSIIKKFLNIEIIIAYSMTLISSWFNTYALKGMPLKMTALSEASGYFWVPILGMILLDEKMGKYKIIGGVVIFIGMILFAFGG